MNTSAIVLGGLLFAGGFGPADNPLPFPLPDFPLIPESGTIEIDLDPPTGSSEYEDKQEAAQATIDSWASPIVAIQEGLEDWIIDSNLPDMSSGDFDTGMEAIDSQNMSAYEFAAYAGDQTATFFQYVRSLRNITQSGMGLFFTFIIACGALLVFGTLVIVFIQLTGMLINLIMNGIQTIRDMLPIP